jgi:DNA-binding LacI/PurR family transcriptional regulator
LHGIATELSAAGSALLLVPTDVSRGADDYHGQRVSGGETLVRNAIVDALILCSLGADDPAVRAAIERSVPLVTVGHPRLPKVPLIGPDNVRAAADVAQYLLGLGHRRFIVLTAEASEQRGSSHPLFHQRVVGFRAALLAAGVRAEDIVVHCAADNSRASGRIATHALLSPRRTLPATALFAATDILALGVLDAAAEAAIAVPRGLSVVGFDDIAAAAASVPTLTTVGHDLFGQGRAAARLALRMIAGESVRAPRIGAELIERASSGPAPLG